MRKYFTAHSVSLCDNDPYVGAASEPERALSRKDLSYSYRLAEERLARLVVSSVGLH